MRRTLFAFCEVNKMKKLICVLLTLLMLSSFALADGEATLLRHATEMVRTLDALAADEERLEQFSLDDEVLELAQAMAAGDRTAPTRVMALDYEELKQELLADVPEEIRSHLLRQMPFAFKSGMVSDKGGNALVASAFISAAETFAAPNAVGQGLWVLYYADALPVAVAWFAENGAVHMEGSILADDTLVEDYYFMGEDIPVSFRTIAADRPALDEAALRVADDLQVLARSEAYLDMLDLSSYTQDIVTAYAAQEGTVPTLTLCALTDSAALTLSALTQDLAMLGVSSLSAVSSLRTTTIFADGEASGTGLYVLLYADSAPVVVTWTGANGAYYLSAAFHPGELANCRNAEQVNAWAQSIGLNADFQQPGAMLLP